MQGAVLGPLALFSKAAAPVFAGVEAFRQARSMRQQENINAEIAGIRADQTDTAARAGLEQDLAEYRSIISANDAGANVQTLGILNEVRKLRERDRRINMGNMRQQQADATRRADSYRPGIALTRGIVRGAPSLFEFAASLR